MNKADYKTMVILSSERKKKLDYICEKEVRNKTNMIAVLIDNYYQELQKKEIKEENYDVYDELMKLKGIGWEGNLEESRE